MFVIIIDIVKCERKSVAKVFVNLIFRETELLLLFSLLLQQNSIVKYLILYYKITKVVR